MLQLIINDSSFLPDESKTVCVPIERGSVEKAAAAGKKIPAAAVVMMFTKNQIR
jgi:hypothetical protein